MILPSTHSFTTTIACPTTDDPIQVEVFYAIRDEGVLPERRNIRAVILGVAQESNRDDGAPWELLGQLDNETITQLAIRAAGHWEDERALDRFGHDEV